MYDELVENLRRMANTWLAEEYKVCAEAVRFQVREAADAIEELSAYARQMENLKKDGWYLQKTKMMTYGQATMTRPQNKRKRRKIRTITRASDGIDLSFDFGQGKDKLMCLLLQ